ncbi:unnamed protein product [Parajaminaea phylloscopi]
MGSQVSLAPEPTPLVASLAQSWRWLNSTNFNGTGVEGTGSDIDYSDFVSQQLVANNIAVAAVTLYGWEYMTTLASEIHLYERAYRGSITRLPVLLFALVRYGSIPAVILPAYSVWKDFKKTPSGCLKHLQLCIVVVQLIVSSVFVWRTSAIWRRDRKVVVFTILATILQFALSFYFLWHSTEKLLPNGACMPVPVKSFFNTLPWFYLMAFLYDLALFSLSLYKLWSYTDDATPTLASRKATFSSGTLTPGIVIVSRRGAKDNTTTSSEEEKTDELSMPSPAQEDHTRSLPRKAGGLARFPVEKVRSAHRRYLSLPPLLTRLLGNGLQYFLLASSFNLVSLALELCHSIHAKSLIALYAPLMAMSCQRLILLEVKAVWGPSNREMSGRRELSLVERATRRRESWEGQDGDYQAHFADARRRGSAPATATSAHSTSGWPSSAPPTSHRSEFPFSYSPPATATSATSQRILAPRPMEKTASSGLESSTSIPEAVVKVPEEQRGLALRMAGM